MHHFWRVIQETEIYCFNAYPARVGSGQNPGGTSGVQLHFTIGVKIHLYEMSYKAGSMFLKSAENRSAIT